MCALLLSYLLRIITHMAQYKVPQDVEAEDKLIGPFGFRQFIYLAIAAGSAFLCYAFYNILPPLIILPLPVFALFLILALPLRKEQPMETYVLALIRFYLKPKQRKWNPDGTITYVEIVAPKQQEMRLAKEFGAETASQKIGYLARVMDSRGWASRGLSTQAGLTTEAMADAEHAVDVFDEGAGISKSFANMIAEEDQRRREAAVAQMQKITQVKAQPQDDGPAPTYNPYPSSMHQRIIQPMDATHAALPAAPQPAAQPAAANEPSAATPVAAALAPATPPPPPPPVPKAVSPDIIRLASNDDLSISAIAHEAHRLTGGDEEVVIQLH